MPSTKKEAPAPAPAPAPASDPKPGPMDFLGPNLLTAPDADPKPTSDVLKGKDLVAIYFSAAWCPPCKHFTPVLVDFYNNVGKDGGLEVVYLSSDNSMEEFNEYFGKMPWVAQPVDQQSARFKDKIATSLKVVGFPTLVIMDAKTGNFITDLARVQVTDAGSDKSKQLEVLNEWKKTKPVPVEEAELTGGQGPMTAGRFVALLFKNPMAIFALFYCIKILFKLLEKYGKQKEAITEEGEL